jgi:hypothetical protein
MQMSCGKMRREERVAPSRWGTHVSPEKLLDQERAGVHFCHWGAEPLLLQGSGATMRVVRRSGARGGTVRYFVRGRALAGRRSHRPSMQNALLQSRRAAVTPCVAERDEALLFATPAPHFRTECLPSSLSQSARANWRPEARTGANTRSALPKLHKPICLRRQPTAVAFPSARGQTRPSSSPTSRTSRKRLPRTGSPVARTALRAPSRGFRAPRGSHRETPWETSNAVLARVSLTSG